MMENDDGIRNVKSHACGIVPESVLMDKSLSLEARTVLAYLVSRPNHLVMRLSRIREVLGISDDQAWEGIQKELIDSGYLHVYIRIDEAGQEHQDVTVTDYPIRTPKPVKEA